MSTTLGVLRGFNRDGLAVPMRGVPRIHIKFSCFSNHAEHYTKFNGKINLKKLWLDNPWGHREYLLEK